MKQSFKSAGLSVTVCLLPLLAGCGSMDHLPFLGDKEPDAAKQPKDAIRYDCKGGKSFYVRSLDKESAMWVIYTDGREVRFDKAGDGSGQRYANGMSVLEINANQGSIKDGEDTVYVDCKVAAK